jgi:hypothetical protein
MVIHLLPQTIAEQNADIYESWIVNDLASALRRHGVATLNVSRCSWSSVNNIILRLPFDPNKFDLKFRADKLIINLVGSPLRSNSPELSPIIESIRSKRWK